MLVLQARNFWARFKLNYLGEKNSNCFIFKLCCRPHYISFVFHAVRPEWNFFTDYMQGNLHIHVRFSKYSLQCFSDGWWRRECLILVNISMFCNRFKNLLAETYLQSFWCYCIARDKHKQFPQYMGINYCDFCFQERKLLLFYFHALGYVVPLLLYYTKLGYFFLQLTKGALLFRIEVS